MAKFAGVCMCLLVFALLGLSVQAWVTYPNSQLSSTFYDKSCPNLVSIVRQAVQQAVAKETRIAASILRLHFHDCFVNGCDASLLLDDANGEQSANPNANSARGFDVIDNIKSAVESSCKGVVSCADILALSARESVIVLGGPSWEVLLGRRDSTTSSQSAANSAIPAPTLNAAQLITNFQNQQLSPQDLVALSGGHTVGLAQCRLFRARLYNTSSGSADPDIDPSFRSYLQQNCPSSGGDTNLVPLDYQTPFKFDNLYFQNLLALKAVLFSDQQLYSGGNSTLAALVIKYANDQQAFFRDFSSGATKMSNLNALTGSNGEIRANCRKRN